MSVRDMAGLVARQIAGGRIKVGIGIEDPMKNGYAPDTGLRLSGEKLRDRNQEGLFYDCNRL